MDMFYDVIIGHSFGGMVLCRSCHSCPNEKKAIVILVDPVLEPSDEQLESYAYGMQRAKSADQCMAENPTLSRGLNACQY